MEFWFVGIYKDDASEKEKADLLSEMSFLKHLDPHPHVIRLYGCVTAEGELEVVASLLSMSSVEVLPGCTSLASSLRRPCMYMRQLQFVTRCAEIMQ